MIRFAAIAAAWLALLSTANASEMQGAGDCTKIVSNTERLECYDRAHSDGRGKSQQAFANAVRIGDSKWLLDERWLLIRKTSKIVDSIDFTLTGASRRQLTTSSGSEKRAGVQFRCRDGETQFAIHFAGKQITGRHGRAEIALRIGDNEPKSKEFQLTEDQRALLLHGEGKSISFIQSLFGQKTLVVRAMTEDAGFIEVEFDITDLKRAIEPVRTECGW